MARKIWDFDADLDSIFSIGNILDKISYYFRFVLIGFLMIAGFCTLGV